MSYIYQKEINEQYQKLKEVLQLSDVTHPV